MTKIEQDISWKIKSIYWICLVKISFSFVWGIKIESRSDSENNKKNLYKTNFRSLTVTLEFYVSE